MGIVDWLILGVILAAVGLSVFFICRAKKRGQKCIGCPHSKTCGGCCDK